MSTNDILIVIPARAGSKGIPHKNSKILGSKPLIEYSIDVARQITDDENICITTDDDRVFEIARTINLPVPFRRPVELATDNATTNDVLLHAYEYYHQRGKDYQKILLLQPTSPFRTAAQVCEAINLYRSDIDMVVSVKPSNAAPVICHEDPDGYLTFSLNKNAGRRQDMNPYYEYNGAIYVINPNSLRQKSMAHFDKKIKYVMDETTSLDIDTPLDWDIAEYLLSL